MALLVYWRVSTTKKIDKQTLPSKNADDKLNLFYLTSLGVNIDSD